MVFAHLKTLSASWDRQALPGGCTRPLHSLQGNFNHTLNQTILLVLVEFCKGFKPVQALANVAYIPSRQAMYFVIEAHPFSQQNGRCRKGNGVILAAAYDAHGCLSIWLYLSAWGIRQAFHRFMNGRQGIAMIFLDITNTSLNWPFVTNACNYASAGEGVAEAKYRVIER